MEIKTFKRGGKRAGAGRKPGAKDRATAEQRSTLEELARGYTDIALRTLATVAERGESEAARVSASTALLDRGYGRPRQAVEMTGKDNGPIEIRNVGARELISQRIAGIASRNGTGAATSKPN